MNIDDDESIALQMNLEADARLQNRQIEVLEHRRFDAALEQDLDSENVVVDDDDALVEEAEDGMVNHAIALSLQDNGTTDEDLDAVLALSLQEEETIDVSKFDHDYMVLQESIIQNLNRKRPRLQDTPAMSTTPAYTTLDESDDEKQSVESDIEDRDCVIEDAPVICTTPAYTTLDESDDDKQSDESDIEDRDSDGNSVQSEIEDRDSDDNSSVYDSDQDFDHYRSESSVSRDSDADSVNSDEIYAGAESDNENKETENDSDDAEVALAIGGAAIATGFMKTVRLDNIMKPVPFNKYGFHGNSTIDKNFRGKYKLIDIGCERNSKEEYDKVRLEFEQFPFTVKTIERLQNITSAKDYLYERAKMINDGHSDDSVREVYLYHGTSAEKSVLCEEGLDSRLSRKGHFGKNGIYFSDDPSKCASYSKKGKKKKRKVEYMLKCRVLLGDVKEYKPGQKDLKLKREPQKENVKDGGRKYYDSVKGKPKDFNEFVIYNSRRALIDYVITYTKGSQSSKKQNAPSSTVTQHGSQAMAASPQNDILYSDDDADTQANLQINPAVKDWMLSTIRLPKVDSQTKTPDITPQDGARSIDTSPPPVVTPQPGVTPPKPVRKSPVVMTQEDRLAIEKVRACQIADFCKITGVVNSSIARHYVNQADMDLDVALNMYYTEL
ncbi:unnamed protein product [Owenia fusiformis]|uniref:Uncharacterized protein n=1 Tax=Owenia fusiformis TaxID=6347 RepID=A0A8J1UKA1_OWEFU|nr:unnamed protein product [Owenia fusiformis]